MTPLSPLQLKEHSFSHLIVEANPKGSATGQISLTPEIAVQKHPQNANQWILGLRVILNSSNSELPFLYEIDVNVHGAVEIQADFAPEKRDQIAVVNGLSLLYSAIREMVINMTARSIHGAVSLPTLNFIEIFKAAQIKAKETLPALPEVGANPKEK